jgi:hypothetical protein
MKHTVIIPPANLRFLLVGGFTGTQNATFMSVILVFLDLSLAAIYYAWQNGFQDAGLSYTNVLSFLASVVILLLLAMVVSFLPAFLGGALLSWLLIHPSVNRKLNTRRRFRLGLIIGAVIGMMLVLLILVVPTLWFGRIVPHNGIGYDPISAMLVSAFYGVQIIAAASIAGVWTENQLRLRLLVHDPVNAG